MTDPAACRCSHGFSCHVCDGCRDHHELGCSEVQPPVGDSPQEVTYLESLLEGADPDEGFYDS